MKPQDYLNRQSQSYMRLQFHEDGGKTRILKIPTFWDDINKKWIGAIQTPKTKKLISAEGKDSFELQNNFNKNLNDLFQSDIAEEVFEMFEVCNAEN